MGGPRKARVVRDLSRDQNKEVDFVIRGSDLEIDKRVLDEMELQRMFDLQFPLMHSELEYAGAA